MLVSTISENINLNINVKIHGTHCVLVPLKQKTPITFLCATNIFLINEMSFLMTLINSEILKMGENEIVQVLLFGDKSFSKDVNFRIITSSICFIKDSKRFDESLSR